jgi:KH domain-containing protein
MQEVFINNLKKIRKLKNKLEKALKIKLIVNNKVEIESKEDDAFSEYLAGKVIEALSFGFQLTDALQLGSEEFMFEKINIKKYVRPSRLKTVLGRIIGKRGKFLKTFTILSDCGIQIKDYTIALIGRAEDIDIAMGALMKLIRGSPHPKVYAFLERNKALKREKIDEDLGLK